MMVLTQNNGRNHLWNAMIVVFLFFGISIFLFTRMDGGIFLMAEVLSGQLPKEGVEGQVQTFWNDKEEENCDSGVWGIDDIEFQERHTFSVGKQKSEISKETATLLKDFNYLKNNYYIIDKRTAFTPSQFDVELALSTDFSIDKTMEEPKILLFHTHANEGYANSDMSKGLEEGIVGAGIELKRILEEDYGISVLHYIEEFDTVDGRGQRTGAYERMENPIRQILEENPSIEVSIDLHRDGVGENTRLVTEMDGESFAQIMFVNGLTCLSENGVPKPISGLTNPYIQETLGFSLQMQLASQQQFPDFNRRIFLNPYRLSTHMTPRSTLVEVGAQTNTKEEAKNAMKPLAKILTDVLLKD